MQGNILKIIINVDPRDKVNHYTCECGFGDHIKVHISKDRHSNQGIFINALTEAVRRWYAQAWKHFVRVSILRRTHGKAHGVSNHKLSLNTKLYPFFVLNFAFPCVCGYRECSKRKAKEVRTDFNCTPKNMKANTSPRNVHVVCLEVPTAHCLYCSQGILQQLASQTKR